jgi:large subunit ribosomal protein L4
MKCAVTTLNNEAAGEIELDDAVFGLPARKDILARMVNWQLAKRRAGTHKVKTRSRGGGRAFGPVVRDHSHKLPKKVRKLALKIALSVKAADGKLVVLQDTALDEAKTKPLAERFGQLGWSSVLVVDGESINQNFARAARMALTKDAVQALEARLK